MSYIQLIEKAALPTSVWLTFWDLDGQHQVSLEIATSSEGYVLGAVYRLDRDAEFEHLALQPVREPSILGTLDLLIPLAVSLPPSEPRQSRMTAVTRETATGLVRSHDSVVSVLH